ncbi:hypothetical protein AB0D57_17230 [Streptomyces sp. NPDC048275]|uniref:hypothetical protein n=1 Tax=Streptomyces sp. NPDC048275 TaxID=3155629 RepID=UPI0033DE10FD
MTTTRRRVLWLSAVLALVLLTTGAGAVLWKVRKSDTRLSVEITGLPDGARPNVAITGADGFKRSVTASTTLKLPPGSFHLTPAPAKAAHATYYTADAVLTAAVRSGKLTRVVVDYRVAVSDKARILNYANPGLISPPKGDQVLFRADAPTARGLRAGDILLAAEGPQTPEGLLRRVIRIERRGSVLAVRTAPAKLNEAMPKAVLRFPKTPEHASQGTDMALAAYTASDDPKDLAPEVTLKMDTWKRKALGGNISCGVGLPVFKAEMDWPQVDFAGSDMGFNENDLVWAQLQARIQYSMKTTWGTPHAAQCSWDTAWKSKWKFPAWAVQLVRVGPFSVHPTWKWIAGVEAKAETGLKFESEISEDFTVKTRLSLRPWASAHIQSNRPAKRKAEMAGATEGKLKGKVGFRIGIEAAAPLDVFTAGLYLEVAAGVEGGIEPFKREAKVEAFLEGGAGMEVAAGEFAGREIGASIPLKKKTLWKTELPPALAFATDRAVHVQTGRASPDVIATLPIGLSATQLTWSPNGKQLAWSATPRRDDRTTTPRVYLADLETGTVDRWECNFCRISFAGENLLSGWNTLTNGENDGFARYRIGQEPKHVLLANQGSIHDGLSDDQIRVAGMNNCGSGGCNTMPLYGGSPSSGDTLIGVPWPDCHHKLFRVNSKLQASPLPVTDLLVMEPGHDKGWLLASADGVGCGDDWRKSTLQLSEMNQTGHLSTVPLPRTYQSWDACSLWYDRKGTPHAVVAPVIDDGDPWTSDSQCDQQPLRTFKVLKKQGSSWQATKSTVLLQRTSSDDSGWNATLQADGRLVAENSTQRVPISNGVRAFAWSPQTG